MPAADLAVVPDGLDLMAASTVPLNGLAAAQIVDLLGDAPTDGNRLLVTGAAGAVGGYVAALAQDRGWQVTGLARAEDEKFVRGLGADFTTHAEPGWDAVADGAALQETLFRLGPRRRGSFVGVRPNAVPDTERRDHHSRRGQTHPDGPRLGDLLARARGPANFRPECTRSCRWTRSPTPTGPWRRAGCAVATCSSPSGLWLPETSFSSISPGFIGRRRAPVWPPTCSKPTTRTPRPARRPLRASRRGRGGHRSRPRGR